MPPRTQLFQLLPWEGGVNTSLDPSVIPAHQLTKAQNIVFGTRSSRKKRDGINFDWDDAVNAANSIIGGVDFWYGSSTVKTQLQVTLSDSKTIYKYSGGPRTALTLDAGATAWGSAITDATFLAFNNQLLIAVDGASNVIRKWAGGTANVFDLGGTPPPASIIQEHLGRVWANDKTNVDRLHYCTTGNAEEWNGIGDSGAIDIGIGDGDPEGIKAVIPFKGTLFVAKKTRLYRVLGADPESFEVQLVSRGIGCIGPNAWTYVDNDDVMYVSERGIHSLAATDTYGDFQSTFLSKDIQKTFNEKFVKTRLKYIKAAYISNLNSIAFAVTDSDVNSTSNNTLWLYNFDQKAWYSWPNVSCQAMFLVSDADQKRVYLGTNENRLAKTQNGTNYDINSSGTSTSILFNVTTGFIFGDSGPYTVKGFKRFGLVYTPQGNHTITVNFTIDNFTPQSLIFQQLGAGADLLGVDFTLGSSSLGYSVVNAPYIQTVDGYGRGFQVEMLQSGVTEVVEIQGFFVEYEVCGPVQETR